MDIRVEFSGWGCVLLALLCLTLPLDWLAAAVMAAIIHESFHVLSVFLLGGKIGSVCIGAGGTELQSSPMTAPREILAILAGPAGSLVLMSLREFFPKIALCGLVQGLFNLLPVYPLDGGRALATLCGAVFPGKMAGRICNGTEIVMLALILGAGLWGTFVEKLGISPLFLSFLILLTATKRKKSCKEGILRVQ
ncbi:MAG: site-2 protease family protein [Faecousia sp.]